MLNLLKTVFAMALGLVLAGAAAATQPVIVIPLVGAIGPASADFVTHGLLRAEKDNAQLVVLQMDTPGGLDLSMRQIIKAILASPVPVATFVAPSGARAASAGTYILYASHVAAMAPGTNLGAATPVAIGMPEGTKPPQSPDKGRGSKDKEDQGGKSDKSASESGDTQSAMSRKHVHDAAAYIRGLAQLRGRNAEWAERAVREAVSLSADEARAQHVVDLTARDVPDLLAKLNGRKITTASGEHVLSTTAPQVVTLMPDWKIKFLTVITDPSVALILMMIGVYGLFFEFSSPGFALPGVVGAVCLLLSLFALQMLPVNYAGLGLVVLGLGFMVAEAFFPTFGALGVGGVVAFAIGALMLIDTDQPGFGIPPSLIAAITLVTAGFIFFVSGAVLKARRRPVVTGKLVGSTGTILDDLQSEGWARVHSERWRVHSAVPLKEGQQVQVTARDGLVLTVAPLGEVRKGEVS